MSRISVMQPFLGAGEIAAVTEILTSGWVAQGPRVAAFEVAFARHQEADHAVAVSSCTTALHAYADLGRGEGSFPVAEEAAGQILSLPIYPHITPAPQEFVVEALRKAVVVE